MFADMIFIDIWNINEKNPDASKNENGISQMIGMGKAIRRWINLPVVYNWQF